MQMSQIKVGGLLLSLLWGGNIAVAGDVFEGKKVYKQHCLNCHGVAGESDMPGVPNFARGERLIKPDLELKRAIQSGAGVMPGFSPLLTGEDIENAITYIRTFL